MRQTLPDMMRHLGNSRVSFQSRIEAAETIWVLPLWWYYAFPLERRHEILSPQYRRNRLVFYRLEGCLDHIAKRLFRVRCFVNRQSVGGIIGLDFIPEKEFELQVILRAFHFTVNNI